MINFWMDTDRFSIYFSETYDRLFIYHIWSDFANDMCTGVGPIGYNASSTIDLTDIRFDVNLLDKGFII